jgi:hypothetical protein
MLHRNWQKHITLALKQHSFYRCWEIGRVGGTRPCGHHRSAALPAKPSDPKLGAYPKYSDFTLIRMIKSRRMKLAGHEARMGRRGITIGFWWENQKGLDVGERMILSRVRV